MNRWDEEVEGDGRTDDVSRGGLWLGRRLTCFDRRRKEKNRLSHGSTIAVGRLIPEHVTRKVIGVSDLDSLGSACDLPVALVSTMKAVASTKRANPTSQLLLEAAITEFNENGYDGTDTNRIARRAGFAPQTFYRWYEDKADIFIAVYRRWQSLDTQSMVSLLQADASEEALVDACVTHFLAYRRFRRSLRYLAYENPRVKEARTANRLNLIAFAQKWNPDLKDAARVATSILQIERLADAIVEDEFLDMSLPGTAARAVLAKIFRELRGSRTAASQFAHRPAFPTKTKSDALD